VAVSEQSGFLKYSPCNQSGISLKKMHQEGFNMVFEINRTSETMPLEKREPLQWNHTEKALPAA
jgi:hypothetical protein